MPKTSNAKPRPSKLEGFDKKSLLNLVMGLIQILAFVCKHADKVWAWIRTLFED